MRNDFLVDELPVSVQTRALPNRGRYRDDKVVLTSDAPIPLQELVSTSLVTFRALESLKTGRRWPSIPPIFSARGASKARGGKPAIDHGKAVVTVARRCVLPSQRARRPRARGVKRLRLTRSVFSHAI